MDDDRRPARPDRLRQQRPSGADPVEDLPVTDLPSEVEVRGRVAAGVEHGSVVLQGPDGRTWQLGRGNADLVGRTVVLRGRPRPDVLTTTQQGVPLEVLEVEVDPDG